MTETALLRLAFSLVLIVLLLLALAWVARRSKWLRGTQQSGLRVLAMQNLGSRGALAIVEAQDARLVLGITAQQITLLHTLPADPSAPDIPSETSETSFGARLGKALKRQ